MIKFQNNLIQTFIISRQVATSHVQLYSGLLKSDRSQWRLSLHCLFSWLTHTLAVDNWQRYTLITLILNHPIICRYQKSSRHGRMGYEDDFIRYLQTLINDVEKRIRRGHQRLALNSQQNSVRYWTIQFCHLVKQCTLLNRSVVSPCKTVNVIEPYCLVNL